MTKKHFKALAEAIAKIEPKTQRAVIAKEIGIVCKENNSRFNWVIWYEACQVTE